MAKYYGYCYDSEGEFTEMIPVYDKPIYEKQTFYKEETKEVITEEKLCELHQSIEDGTYKEPPRIVITDEEGNEMEIPNEEPISKYDCPDCVMRDVKYETIKVPYEEDVIIGFEPDIPENCTLEVCPDGIYYPLFKDGKWVKTVEPTLEEPKEEASAQELLGQQISDLEIEVMGQVEKRDELGQQLSDLEISLIEENGVLGQQVSDLEISLMELEGKIAELTGGNA